MPYSFVCIWQTEADFQHAVAHLAEAGGVVECLASPAVPGHPGYWVDVAAEELPPSWPRVLDAPPGMARHPGLAEAPVP